VTRGKFITLEGIEGAGKSTATKFVRSWLEEHGLAVRVTREPGGTPLAERVRQIVLERGEEIVSPVTETLLMFAARALHVQNVILPALARGEWVVCDRFTDATRAYQGSGRGVDARLLGTLAAAVHGGLDPDCTLLLDLPAAAGLARARARPGAGLDRFEAETLAFFETVRAGYLALARAEPRRFHVLDATAPLAEVERGIRAALSGLPAQANPA
jgi:dTMP kinase